MKSSKRFVSWKAPKPRHGKLTRWNWMVQYPQYLTLGKETDIGAFTYINALHGVEIGDRVKIGSHCSIYSVSTIDHKQGRVVLSTDCRIGAHSTVMPGVTIGKNSIVGAHSFVNRDLPANVIAVGCPVRIIKRLRQK